MGVSKTGGAVDITAIKVSTDNLPADPADEVTSTAIKAKTDNLPVDPADASDINDVLVLIKAKTDNLPTDPADASVIVTAFGVTDGKIDTVDTEVDKLIQYATLATKLYPLAADPIEVQSDNSDFGWGTLVQIVGASVITNPFMIVGVHCDEPDANGDEEPVDVEITHGDGNTVALQTSHFFRNNDYMNENIVKDFGKLAPANDKIMARIAWKDAAANDSLYIKVYVKEIV